MKSLFLLFVTLALVTACSEPQKPAAKDPETFNISEAKTQIDAENKVYGARFMQNDSNYYKDRYMADASVLGPNEPAITGREAIRKYFYNDGKNNEITILIQSVSIYGSASLVVEEGIYDFPDGKGRSIDKGKFIALWKQEGGKWKIFREIWNTDMPPATKP